MKKKTRKKQSPTRSLKDLVKDEDGFVSKETILKVGLLTAAGLGAWGTVAEATSSHHYNVSTNIMTAAGNCIDHIEHNNQYITCY